LSHDDLYIGNSIASRRQMQLYGAGDDLAGQAHEYSRVISRLDPSVVARVRVGIRKGWAARYGLEDAVILTASHPRF
jgi:hypothetical protein